MKYNETTEKLIFRRRPNPLEAVKMSLEKTRAARNKDSEYQNGLDSERALSGERKSGSKKQSKHILEQTRQVRQNSVEMTDIGVTNKTTIEVNLVQEHVFVDDQIILNKNVESKRTVSKNKKTNDRKTTSRLDSPKFTVTDARENGHGDLIVVEHPDIEDDDVVDSADDNHKDNHVHEGLENKITDKAEIVKTKEIKIKKTTKKKRSKSAGRASSAQRKPLIDTPEMIEYHINEDVETVENIEPVCVPASIWQRPEKRRRKKKVYKETMVRVGGGWMQLCDYLHYHAPVRVHLKNAAKVKKGEEKLLIKSVRPTSAISNKAYDRPSWTYVSKGFKGFGTTVCREFV